MKNTIEKALQKQKEAKAAKKSEIVEEKLEDAVKSIVSEDSKVTIEKPSPSELEPPAEKIVAEEKEFTNKKSPLDEFVIDFARLDKNGHISLNGERKQINEEYREIKRKLLANAFGSLAK
ncbi:MAG TPA: exopolysaccharide biosynthesis protein, partial [Pseudoalteromonas sp.]|nr:exopolysaccharide biosynthesis protein [Pseudoalteromonas sp.]